MTDNQALYIVATPIGNLDDISSRALNVLRQVNIIAAEDTRHAKNLLNHYAISTPLISYHDHNEHKRTAAIIQRLQAGESIALISDAGTPLISDPGYPLVRGALEAGLNVIPIPGASAMICALSAAGLPTDLFQFVGFLSSSVSRRRRRLNELTNYSGTMVFYESPHRIQASLTDMAELFGSTRRATVCRELTKKFESICPGQLGELARIFSSGEEPSRGEFVVLVEGCEAIDAPLSDWVDATIELYEFMPLKKAARFISRLTGARSQNLYAEADLKVREQNILADDS